MKIEVNIDDKYGLLRILEVYPPDKSRQGRRFVKAICDCGTIKEIRKETIASGVTVSCGCYGRQQRLKSTIKHHMSKSSPTPSPLYTVWDSIIQRCTNPNNSGFRLYGGRGINICYEWRKDFFKFFQWAISHGYEKGKQIDRINNELGYESNNCRWVTTAEQARNKRTNVNVIFNGRKMCLQDVANELGLSRSTLYYRVKHNIPLDKPVKSRMV